mmetsp:Transcript_5199/g.7810  ORF Transcript_5199/g.7810 Transcript_5199/m.7810 type:complete len:261 (+) Transcript_5199:849-1631(+)
MLSNLRSGHSFKLPTTLVSLEWQFFHMVVSMKSSMFLNVSNMAAIVCIKIGISFAGPNFRLMYARAPSWRRISLGSALFLPLLCSTSCNFRSSIAGVIFASSLSPKRAEASILSFSSGSPFSFFDFFSDSSCLAAILLSFFSLDSSTTFVFSQNARPFKFVPACTISSSLLSSDSSDELSVGHSSDDNSSKPPETFLTFFLLWSDSLSDSLDSPDSLLDWLSLIDSLSDSLSDSADELLSAETSEAYSSGFSLHFEISFS